MLSHHFRHCLAHFLLFPLAAVYIHIDMYVCVCVYIYAYAALVY